MAQTFNTLSLKADTAGCGHWRMIFPEMALQTATKDVMVISSMKLITDVNFFKGIRMVRLQRQVSDAQCKYFLDFLKPLSQSIGFWIVYEIDDVINYNDIPKFNIGRHAFKCDNFYKNIKKMLEASDFITTTTEHLKKYYVNEFGIDADKFVVIPNHPPRWWAGESYNYDDIMKRFKKNKRPRIGFPGSSSHFDLEMKNGGNDDYTHIIDFIKNNVDKYEFVFIGGYPMQLESLIKEKKIDYMHSSDILNYPRELYAKDLQAIIAPLNDCLFNSCKSNIKLLEGWALGIPVFAQDIKCYSDWAKPEFLFKDSNDLAGKIKNVLGNKREFSKAVKAHRHVMDFGNKDMPNGWWLEKNLQMTYNIYSLPQKTLTLSLTGDNNER